MNDMKHWITFEKVASEYFFTTLVHFHFELPNQVRGMCQAFSMTRETTSSQLPPRSISQFPVPSSRREKEDEMAARERGAMKRNEEGLDRNSG